MDWELFSIVPAILLGIFFIVLLYGVGKAWKTNNKFYAFVFLTLAVAIGVMFYAIYGKKFFG